MAKVREWMRMLLPIAGFAGALALLPLAFLILPGRRRDA
jgi:hypothetical protein